MSPDYLEEELEIMEEANQHSDAGEAVAAGIDIDDPIRVLNLSPIVSVNTGISLKEVIDLLNSKKMGCVTVLDKSGETVGIFTERDVLRKVIGKVNDLNSACVDDYMTVNPEVLSENDPIAFALNRMSSGGYRHIPITRNREVKFMLSVKDIVDQIALAYRKRVLNLPPDLKQQTSQYGG